MNDPDIRRVITRLALRREYESEDQWRRALELLNEVLGREGEGVRSDGFRVTFYSTMPAEGNASLQQGPESPDGGRMASGQDDSGSPRAPMQLENRDVMVVHGRNIAARNAMFDFLHSIGLRPVEWEQAVQRVEQGSPYIEDVVRSAIMNAGAVVVLFTGDDEARLKESLHAAFEPSYERDLTPQPRPNVILETGMALMAAPDKTIIIELERTRPISDIEGRNRVRFDGGAAGRHALATRLRTLGLSVDTNGDHWLNAGNFGAARGNASAPPGAEDDNDAPAREEATQQDPSSRSLNVQRIRTRWQGLRTRIETRSGRRGLLARVSVSEYQAEPVPPVLVLGVPISELREVRSATGVIQEELRREFGCTICVNINPIFPSPPT